MMILNDIFVTEKFVVSSGFYGDYVNEGTEWMRGKKERGLD